MTLTPGVTERVTLRLRRGGSVHGQVISDSGRPLAGWRVEVVSLVRNDAPYRVFSVVGRTQSDRDGRYHVKGLAGGRYFLRASMGAGEGTPSNDVYYPGVADPEKAMPVELEFGQDAAVTLAGHALPLGSISGRLIQSGSPRAIVRMLVQRMDEDHGDSITKTVIDLRPDGRFEIPRLKSGVYGITAEALAPAGVLVEAAFLETRVEPGATRELTMALQPCATMRGTIEWNAAPPEDAAFSRFVSVWPIGEAAALRQGFSSPRGGNADASTFEITGIVGEHRIEVSPPDGWIVEAVLLEDGTDVLDTPPVFGPGTHYSNVRVVLSDKVATIVGVVHPEFVVPSGMTVTVFPADRSRWGRSFRFIQPGVVQDDGSFTVDGVQPGHAYLVSLHRWGLGSDPATLEQLARTATPVYVDRPGVYTVKGLTIR